VWQYGPEASLLITLSIFTSWYSPIMGVAPVAEIAGFVQETTHFEGTVTRRSRLATVPSSSN